MRVGYVLPHHLALTMDWGWSPLVYVRSGVIQFVVIYRRSLRVREPLS